MTADHLKGIEEFEAEERADEKMVSLNFTSWNRIADWLKRLHSLKAAA